MTDDYYRFEDRHMVMIGERTGRQFRIGDEVKIRVANVVIEESSVDFEIVDMVSNARPSRRQTAKVIHAGRKEGRSGDKERIGEKRDRKARGGSKERPAKEKNEAEAASVIPVDVEKTVKRATSRFMKASQKVKRKKAKRRNNV